jgi:hypothetical protein
MVSSLTEILKQGLDLIGLYSLFLSHLLDPDFGPQEAIQWFSQPCPVHLQSSVFEDYMKAQIQVHETAIQWVNGVQKCFKEAVIRCDVPLSATSFLKLLSKKIV